MNLSTRRIQERTAMLLCWLAAGTVLAEERVDYLRQVKPLLTARCYACHGALQQKSGLRLDTAGLMKKGGDAGPILVPGKSASSSLVERISSGTGRMPPKSEGEPLEPEQIALIRKWIDQGAVGPADEKPEADPREHWAFRPPVRPALPQVKNAAWVRNGVDAFLAAGHEKAGLKPQRSADRPVLLRRVYLDLIGLPPTREETQAFLADTSADAYEKVVDQLLGSKQYGERWGRHWMDIWRYSDWWGLGAEVRNSQKHIWHWRDWIIESLNADKGYDQMLREMLAADELYPTDADKLRATGYLVRPYFIFNRNTWMDEVVEHTSKGFLGLMVNCAKCHDHKYDPVAQNDYYRLRAFFEPYQVRTDMVPGESDFTKNGVPRVFDCNLDAPTFFLVRGDEKNPLKSKKITPGLPELLSVGKLTIAPVTLPVEAHSPGLRAAVLEAHQKQAEARITAARLALEQARKALAEASKAPGQVVEKPAPAVTTAQVKDDFSKARPDVWEMKEGRWAYQNGKLLQQEDGAKRAVLRLKQAPPADFQARLRFSILGGQMWKSVGLSFDVAGENELLVYLSAYAGGSKVQLSYKQGTGHVYPTNALQNRPVKLNEPQDMTLRVRGTLVNVAINGQHAMAYRLPVARKAGHLELIAFDARAEFTAFELGSLGVDVRLTEAGAPPVGKVLTAEQAKLALVVAEKALAAAEVQPKLIQARADADRARQQQPPASNVKELARAAARAEKQAAVAAAEEAAARAQLEGNTGKRTQAEAALVAARKALDNPGEVYTSLRGALKAPESNLEGEPSRSKPFPTTSTGRRSALARWLTDRQNPLTARVAINHIWARHMGKPLVATIFDFGRKGAAPMNPELLDWLAVELMDKRWSMKHVHRLIVTSSAYRMTSSNANPQVADQKSDAENRLYWRMNPVRMEAQVIRDSLLHLSGELDLTLGGPSIPANTEASRRRSLYFVHSHNEHNKFLSTFDDANVLDCYRRAESIVPQQVLALENSTLALSAAEKIARRIKETTDEAFVGAAFQTVLGSTPTKEERAACAEAVKELKEVAVRDRKPDAEFRARANLVQALLNHNDFITIR